MTEQEPRDFLQILCQMAGRSTGNGSDHTGAPFSAQLHLRPLLGRQAVSTEYAAQTLDGHVVHHEQATIGFDTGGALRMWVVNSNNPRVQSLPLSNLALHENGDLAAHFASASESEPDTNTMRIAIQILLKPGGSLQLTHCWALPGQPVVPRSSATLALDLTAS